MHCEPAHKGIEPTGAGSFLRVHSETMATLFIKMEFDGALCSLPAIDEPVTGVAEKGVVGSQGDESGLRILASQCSCDCQHRAGGKANHADPVGIDMPLGRPLTDEGKCRAGV